MNESSQLYFNFPVRLMQDILYRENSRMNFLNDILYYHIAGHSSKIEDFNEYEETELERFKRSATYWNVAIRGDVEKKMSRGFDLIDSFSDCEAMTGINTDIFWDFYKNEKTDFDWECLFAYLALKSIIGKKKYCKTNNTLLFARMAGMTTRKEYENSKGLGFTEYHRNKIISKLETDWHLKYYSRYTRGFYCGFEITLKELMFEAESKREILKKESLRKEKAEILRQWQNRNK